MDPANRGDAAVPAGGQRGVLGAEGPGDGEGGDARGSGDRRDGEGHHNDCIKDIRGARTPRAAPARAPRTLAARRPGGHFWTGTRAPRAAALTGRQSRHQELAKRRADDPVAKQKVELLGERNRTEEHVKRSRRRSTATATRSRARSAAASSSARRARRSSSARRWRCRARGTRSASSPTSRRSAGTTRAPTTPRSRVRPQRRADGAVCGRHAREERLCGHQPAVGLVGA